MAIAIIISWLRSPPTVQSEGATNALSLATAQVGAAVLGVAVKPTIKEVDGQGKVIKTLVRAGLWEVQTPQVHVAHRICVLAYRMLNPALRLHRIGMQPAASYTQSSTVTGT